ncbi:hypothetical protein PoB_004012300 [Plakobranchus ocellatus]|uniref:Uncharacterized protein n=1 Tax=Plakobranchus ocellatus TaxID=259542 RepID=A0AAV4B4C0_9GAST|nr:hypothetical protein PoB_004012300 [Plakobranchus ocellatus]
MSSRLGRSRRGTTAARRFGIWRAYLAVEPCRGWSTWRFKIQPCSTPDTTLLSAPVQALVSMDPVQVDLDRCLASSPPFRRGRDMDQDFPAMTVVSGAGLQ